MMNDRALRVLEFSKIQARLAEFALTGMGRERCLALRPQETLLQAQEALEETEEAQVILTYLGGSPLVEFSDVRPFLTMAEKGASLSPRSLIDIARSLTAARSARSALVTERENTPRVTGLASHLQTFRQLEDAINDAIISEEEISDHASPALADIRRHIRQANERVRDKLNEFIRNPNLQKFLQDTIITTRDGQP